MLSTVVVLHANIIVVKLYHGVVTGSISEFASVVCAMHSRTLATDALPLRTSAVLSGCGLSDTSRIGITRRIVGGNQAGFGTFPWQVRPSPMASTEATQATSGDFKYILWQRLHLQLWTKAICFP